MRRDPHKRRHVDEFELEYQRAGTIDDLIANLTDIRAVYGGNAKVLVCKDSTDTHHHICGTPRVAPGDEDNPEPLVVLDIND